MSLPLFLRYVAAVRGTCPMRGGGLGAVLMALPALWKPRRTHICNLMACCCGDAAVPKEEVPSEATSPAPPATPLAPATVQRQRSVQRTTTATKLLCDADHGVSRDRQSIQSTSERAKLKVAIAMVNTSNRLSKTPKNLTKEQQLDTRHGIWVVAEGARVRAAPGACLLSRSPPSRVTIAVGGRGGRCGEGEAPRLRRPARTLGHARTARS
jgi:hypothetical protein